MVNHPESYEGVNWRDDPLENTPVVRKSQNFLKSRGHSNSKLFQLKTRLVEVIRVVVERKKWTQAEIARHINDFDPAEHMDQPDVSRLLSGNVERFSIERLMFILVALDNRVSLRSEPVEAGKGCIVMADCD